jgi:tetratricopeptide (TPR) repeat protein
VQTWLFFDPWLALLMAGPVPNTTDMLHQLQRSAATLLPLYTIGWRAVQHGLLSALLMLTFSVAWADVYSDVSEKISTGQLQAAQTLISRQLEKQPSDPQMRLMRSQIQVAQGQKDQAIDTLEALTQEFPELPEPYNNLAVLYAGQQRFDSALTALTQAIRARPDYALALENLGDVHAALARQSYLKAKALPSQGPLVTLRLDSKIQLTGQVLQPIKTETNAKP